jgi:hypothetical protein
MNSQCALIDYAFLAPTYDLHRSAFQFETSQAFILILVICFQYRFVPNKFSFPV